MENLKFRSILLIVYTVSFSMCSISSTTNLLTSQAALFVFGDSLYDVGNNNYLNIYNGADSWPYGITTFKFPTGRPSDGRVIPDFIAEYAWLPLIPPYLQPGNNQYTYGVNFASAGAGALNETGAGQVINLNPQLDNFKEVEKILKSKLGDAETLNILSRAVYLIHIGTNDYWYPFLINNSRIFQSLGKEEFVNFVIGNTTAEIEEIYKMGGRKFGLMNMARTDCTPSALIADPNKIGSCFKPVTELIDLHNQAFPKIVKNLETRLHGFKYALHDFETSTNERAKNPSKYGFKEGNKACCGSGPFRGNRTCGYRFSSSISYQLCENVSDYLFFDGVHPTEKLNGQIAQLMWSGKPNITGPYNLKMLFEYKDE